MLKGFSSNQLYDYFTEMISLYQECKDQPEQADLDSAA